MPQTTNSSFQWTEANLPSWITDAFGGIDNIIKLPVLDLKGRMGFTDYIDFLQPMRDMEGHKIKKGVDRFNRPFFALSIATIETNELNVCTLFQRYTNEKNIWVWGGNSFYHCPFNRALQAKADGEILSKLIKSEKVEHEEYDNRKYQYKLQEFSQNNLQEQAAPAAAPIAHAEPAATLATPAASAEVSSPAAPPAAPAASAEVSSPAAPAASAEVSSPAAPKVHPEVTPVASEAHSEVVLTAPKTNSDAEVALEALAKPAPAVLLVSSSRKRKSEIDQLKESADVSKNDELNVGAYNLRKLKKQ